MPLSALQVSLWEELPALPWDEQAACSKVSDPMGAACHAMSRLLTHPSLDGSAMQPHISPGSQHSVEKLLYLLSGIPQLCLHPKGQLPGSWMGQALSVGSALPARSRFNSHISFPKEINNNRRCSALQRRLGCGLIQVQNAPTQGEKIHRKFHNIPCLVVEQFRAQKHRREYRKR